MLDDDFFIGSDARQIHRLIPDLKLLKVDHELSDLISFELNSNFRTGVLEQREELIILFHVEQLRECLREVKDNVLGLE